MTPRSRPLWLFSRYLQSFINHRYNDKWHRRNVLWTPPFLSRDSIYAERAICYRPTPVRLSVCLSVTRVDQPKTVGVSIMKFSSYGTLSLWFLQGKFYLEILMDPPPPERGRQNNKGLGGENKPLSKVAYWTCIFVFIELLRFGVSVLL